LKRCSSRRRCIGEVISLQRRCCYKRASVVRFGPLGRLRRVTRRSRFQPVMERPASIHDPKGHPAREITITIGPLATNTTANGRTRCNQRPHQTDDRRVGALGSRTTLSQRDPEPMPGTVGLSSRERERPRNYVDSRRPPAKHQVSIYDYMVTKTICRKTRGLGVDNSADDEEDQRNDSVPTGQ